MKTDGLIDLQQTSGPWTATTAEITLSTSTQVVAQHSSSQPLPVLWPWLSASPLLRPAGRTWRALRPLSPELPFAALSLQLTAAEHGTLVIHPHQRGGNEKAGDLPHSVLPHLPHLSSPQPQASFRSIHYPFVEHNRCFASKFPVNFNDGFDPKGGAN